MEYKTHIGVYGVLLDANRILLVTKSRGPYSGKLDLPGGQLEHGETIQEGLSREIQEETGIKDVNEIVFFNNFTHHEIYENNGQISFHHIGLVYRIENFSSVDVVSTIDFEDVSGVEWFEVDQLVEENLSPFAWKALNQLK